jgi:hypothetical protein
MIAVFDRYYLSKGYLKFIVCPSFFPSLLLVISNIVIAKELVSVPHDTTTGSR